MEDSPNSESSPRSRWRLPRPSIRLFLVGAVLSLFFSGWWVVSSGNRQRTAVAGLSKHRVSITYAGASSNSTIVSSLRSQILIPLTQYVSKDFLLPVTEVQTRYIEAPGLAAGAEYSSGDIITFISDLDSAESLRLTHTDIKNDDLHAISHLSRLRSLDLSMTRLHEGDLTALAPLDLTDLTLSRTRVNDDALKSLSEMSNLTNLNLTRTKVTGDGLRYIQHLPKLKTLRIQRCLVTRDEYETFCKLRPDVTVKWSALRR